MGAAAIGVALWRYHLQYNPKNAEWFGRDRKSIYDGRESR
jgi:dihydroxyacetone synthase